MLTLIGKASPYNTILCPEALGAPRVCSPLCLQREKQGPNSHVHPVLSPRHTGMVTGVPGGELGAAGDHLDPGPGLGTLHEAEL